MAKFLIGIDEVGRGPLAGPVAVGAVMVPSQFDFSQFEGVRDSKELSEFGREIWFERMRILVENHHVRYAVEFSSAQMIDTLGIAPAIRSAISRALRALKAVPHQSHVLLDGSLRAPRTYLSQETIIGGDASEPLIALASIVAKVRRDRLMRRHSLRFPVYGFEEHKGYGTPKHREAIAKFGLCTLHRKTFCESLMK